MISIPGWTKKGKNKCLKWLKSKQLHLQNGSTCGTVENEFVIQDFCMCVSFSCLISAIAPTGLNPTVLMWLNIKIKT